MSDLASIGNGLKKKKKNSCVEFRRGIYPSDPLDVVMEDHKGNKDKEQPRGSKMN